MKAINLKPSGALHGYLIILELEREKLPIMPFYGFSLLALAAILVVVQPFSLKPGANGKNIEQTHGANRGGKTIFPMILVAAAAILAGIITSPFGAPDSQRTQQMGEQNLHFP